MCIVLFDTVDLVRMNTGVECAGQPGFSSSVQVFKFISKEVAELRVTIYRLSIRSGAIDHSGQCFDNLPERAFSFAQRLLDTQLIVDVMREAVPLNDAPALIPEWLCTALYPAVNTIRTPKAILLGEALAGDEGMAKRLLKIDGIIRVDGGFNDGRQPARTRLLQVRYIQPKKIYQTFIEEGRFAVRTQPPEETRDHVYELRKLALPITQRLLCAHLVVDVDGNDVPLHNRPILITQRFPAAINPTIRSIRSTHAVFL